MDQHLECTDTGKMTLGTDLLKTVLRTTNLCKVIYSANNNEDDQEQYMAAGAHACIGKGHSMKTVASKLDSIFKDYINGSALPSGQWVLPPTKDAT